MTMVKERKELGTRGATQMGIGNSIGSGCEAVLVDLSAMVVQSQEITRLHSDETDRP